VKLPVGSPLEVEVGTYLTCGIALLPGLLRLSQKRESSFL
jgi:hypothetical protein